MTNIESFGWASLLGRGPLARDAAEARRTAACQSLPAGPPPLVLRLRARALRVNSPAASCKALCTARRVELRGYPASCLTPEPEALS